METPFEIPAWASDLLLKKHVRNLTIYEYKELEDSDVCIDLATKPLIMLGKVADGTTKLFVVKLLAYSKQFLVGPHLVSIVDPVTRTVTGPPLWVNSLTCFRRMFFSIVDRLTFERATFLLFPKQQKVVRLKCIRAFLTLPEIELTSKTRIYVNFTQFYLPCRQIREGVKRKRIAAEEEEEEDIAGNGKGEEEEQEEEEDVQFLARKRVSNQITQSMLVLFTAYLREHSSDFEQAAHFFTHDIRKASSDVLQWIAESRHVAAQELQACRSRLSQKLDLATAIASSSASAGASGSGETDSGVIVSAPSQVTSCSLCTSLLPYLGFLREAVPPSKAVTIDAPHPRKRRTTTPRTRAPTPATTALPAVPSIPASTAGSCPFCSTDTFGFRDEFSLGPWRNEEVSTPAASTIALESPVRQETVSQHYWGDDSRDQILLF